MIVHGHTPNTCPSVAYNYKAHKCNRPRQHAGDHRCECEPRQWWIRAKGKTMKGGIFR